jgi:hypothetical protein
MSSAKISFIDSLVTAAKTNPFAAALIGGGALWLLAGSEGMKGAARSAAGVASPVVDAGSNALRSAGSIFERSPPTAPDLDQASSFSVGETARKASGKVSEVVGTFKDRIEEGVTTAQDQLGRLADPMPGRETFEKAQSALADALEQQPLLLGAVGLVVGAAVAGALRGSELENELVGQYSDQVKSDLGHRTEAVGQSLREASDTLKAELSDLGQEAVDRAKQTTLDAVAAARAPAGTA